MRSGLQKTGNQSSPSQRLGIDPADHALELVSVNRLTPYANNARKHSRSQIREIAKSIEQFGFVNPILIDDDGQIIAGHGRVAAAMGLGVTEYAPRGKSAEEVRALWVWIRARLSCGPVPDVEATAHKHAPMSAEIMVQAAPGAVAAAG